MRIPRECKIYSHLCGKNHSKLHKFTVGISIMFIGVSVAKSAVFFEVHVFHYVLDATGYLLHGIGALPFAEHVLEKGGDD